MYESKPEALCTLFILAMALQFACTGLDIQLPQTSPPRLFLSESEMVSLRERAQTPHWEQVRADLLADADSCLNTPLEIPRQGGQWTHWYSCAKDGADLKALSPTEHECTQCGTVYRGFPYDDAYITTRHNHFISQVELLGRAYALEPASARAARIREILLTYAAFYKSLPYHDKDGGNRPSGGRLFAQTLDESVALCRLCFGYDLAYGDPCFSDEDRRILREELLLPMCETIRRNDMRISNWQSWHNAGVGCAGLLLRERDLVEWAINGKSGFLYQMEHSVLPGGMWYEGAPAYHWYAFLAHFYLLEAAGRAGMDLWGLPEAKRMLDAPLRQVYPDLSFPAIHDSSRLSITGQRGFYEAAYSHFKDNRYLPLLKERDTWQALFYGVDTLPPTEDALPPASSNDGDETLAILRDKHNQTAVFLDYTRAQVGHMHPATLNLVLYAQGGERIVDPGRLPYGNPLHKAWCRQTIAHNTVVINQSSHQRIHSECTAFETNDRYSLARARATLEGGKHTLDRTLLLADTTLVDVFQCQSSDAAVFDLPLHFQGLLGDPPATTPIQPWGDTPGYSEFQDVRAVEPRCCWFTFNTAPDKRIVVQVLDEAGQFLAVSPGYQHQEHLPMLLRRAEGMETVFLTVYHLLHGTALPTPASLKRDQDGTLCIRTNGLDLRVAAQTTLVSMTPGDTGN